MRNILNRCFRAVALISVLILAVSCEKDNNFKEYGESNIEANILTYSPASTDQLALGAAEYVIRRCRLYAFDGDRLDNMIYFDNISTGNLGEYIARMKVSQTSTKKLYCIINEPNNAEMHSRLSLINNPSALKEMEYAIADYVSKAYNSDATFAATDFCLPMYGESSSIFSTITSTPETDIPISLNVTRSVARVDVYLQLKADMLPGSIKIDANTKLDIVNTRAKGFLSHYTVPSNSLINITDAVSGPSTALSIPVRNVADNAKAARVFTFYTPERSQDNASELGLNLKGVDFNGVRKSYTIFLKSTGSNGLTKIKRNQSHKLICTFSPTFAEIIITSTVTKWDDGGIDGTVVVDAEGNYHGDSSIIYPWASGGTDVDVDIH